jgi:hypothetical protein
VADPAGTLDGATDEMEGVAAEGEVGVRGDVDEEVPPQPVNTRQEKGKGQQLHPHNDRHVSWAWGLSCRGFAGEPHRHFIFCRHQSSPSAALNQFTVTNLAWSDLQPFPIWDWTRSVSCWRPRTPESSSRFQSTLPVGERPSVSTLLRNWLAGRECAAQEQGHERHHAKGE